VAALKETLDEMGTDESGATGHKNFHVIEGGSAAG
jgi:hypothetical protein